MKPVERGMPAYVQPGAGSFGPPCPECGETDSKVIDVRPSPNALRRRRCCVACELRWTTYETTERQCAPDVGKKIHAAITALLDAEQLVEKANGA